MSAIAYADGKVYAGGTFADAGGDANADRLAVWDGASWKPFCGSAGMTFTGNVDALQIVGSTLYVGGAFQNWGNDADADYLIACDRQHGRARPHDRQSVPGTGLRARRRPQRRPVRGRALERPREHPGRRQHRVPRRDRLARDGRGRGRAGARSTASSAASPPTDRRRLRRDRREEREGIAQADNVVKWNGSDWSALGADPAGDDGWFPTSTFIYGMTVSAAGIFATGTFQNANGDPRADNVALFRNGAWQPLGSDGAGNGPWIGNGLALAIAKAATCSPPGASRAPEETRRRTRSPPSRSARSCRYRHRR